MSGRHPCPVCHETMFQEFNSHEPCPRCGWFDVAIQTEFPDDDAVCNTMSLNQAKKAFREGRVDLIRHNMWYVDSREDATDDKTILAYRKMREDDERFVRKVTGEDLYHDDSKDTIVRALNKLAKIGKESTDIHFVRRVNKILKEFPEALH